MHQSVNFPKQAASQIKNVKKIKIKIKLFSEFPASSLWLKYDYSSRTKFSTWCKEELSPKSHQSFIYVDTGVEVNNEYSLLQMIHYIVSSFFPKRGINYSCTLLYSDAPFIFEVLGRMWLTHWYVPSLMYTRVYVESEGNHPASLPLTHVVIWSRLNIRSPTSWFMFMTSTTLSTRIFSTTCNGQSNIMVSHKM